MYWLYINTLILSSWTRHVYLPFISYITSFDACAISVLELDGAAPSGVLAEAEAAPVGFEASVRGSTFFPSN